MHAADMSLPSPTTPGADGESSTSSVYIPDRNGSFGSFSGEMSSFHDFPSYDEGLGSTEASEVYPVKAFAPLSQAMGAPGSQSQFAPFDDIPLSSLQQDASASFASMGSSLLGDHSTAPFRYPSGPQNYLDFSSPVDNWSNSSTGENDQDTAKQHHHPSTTVAQTIVPSQTMTHAPRTPPSTTLYPRSTAPSSSSASRQHHLRLPSQRGTIIRSSPTSHLPSNTPSSNITAQSLIYYPFTSPSPSVSPTHPSSTNYYTLPSSASQPSTPTRPRPYPGSTRAKLHRLPSHYLQSSPYGTHCSSTKKWEPPIIYPRADKKHKCPHPGCGGAFQRQEHLKRHETSHTGDRPHECKVVGCKFKGSRSDNLKQHMKRHRVKGGRVRYVPDLVID